MKFLGAMTAGVLPWLVLMGCGAMNPDLEPDPTRTETKTTAISAEPQTPAEPETVPAPEKPARFEPGAFEDPEVCSTCHRDMHNEWARSMHANAWQNAWYQPDLILAHRETDGATDLLCGACHAPIAARTGLLPPVDGSRFDATSRQGISCDFCHTVTEVGPMFNMGHISQPGNVKFGPRGDGRSLYHEVENTGIHSRADFCGSCHMVLHPATGVQIIDTWEDWKNNEYGKQNIRCQDCHMTPTPGVSKRPGRAALMGKPRDNLAFHGFIGGSSYIQDVLGNTEQAEMSREFLRAAAEVGLDPKVTDDGTLELTVEVRNVGAGHKIPTGTSYIRKMWLQVDVTDAAGKVIYRSGQVDAQNHVDPQATVFRVLFRDAEGNLTGKSWRAHSIGYDRRIPAMGKDSETYRIPLPGKGQYHVTTRLMYRSFTQSFLDEAVQRTGHPLPPAVSVEMAAARKAVNY